MKINKFLLPVVAVAGLAIYLSLFTVKEINQAIVLQFGDPKRVLAEPGLKYKILMDPQSGTLQKHQLLIFFDLMQLLLLVEYQDLKFFYQDKQHFE